MTVIDHRGGDPAACRTGRRESKGVKRAKRSRGGWLSGFKHPNRAISGYLTGALGVNIQSHGGRAMVLGAGTQFSPPEAHLLAFVLFARLLNLAEVRLIQCIERGLGDGDGRLGA
jgi:hypothetical protein